MTFESYNPKTGIVMYSKNCLFIRKVYKEISIEELRKCWLQFLTDRQRMTPRQESLAAFYHSIHELINERIVK